MTSVQSMALVPATALVPINQPGDTHTTANQITPLQTHANQLQGTQPLQPGANSPSAQRAKPQIPFESLWEELLFLLQRMFKCIRLKYWDALGETDQAVAQLFRERMDEKTIVAAYDLACHTSSHIVKLSSNLDINRDSQLIERLIQVVDTAVHFTEVRVKLEALCAVRMALQSLVPIDAPIPESYQDNAQDIAYPGFRFARSERANRTMLTEAAAAAIADDLKNKTDPTAHAQAVSDFKSLPVWKQLCVVDLLSPKQLTLPLLASLCNNLALLPVEERMLIRAYLALHNSQGLVSDDTESRHTGKKYGSIARAWDVVAKYRAKTHNHESACLTESAEDILLQAAKKPTPKQKKPKSTRARA